MLYDTIVIGAGQAGLAVGYHLQRAGLRFVILEAGAEPGGSWPNYYDSLTLNTPARYSALPGLALRGDPDHYPVRDEMTAYLREYASFFGMPIIPSTRARQIERIDGRFQVLAGDRTTYTARTLVAATGTFGRPYRPAIATLAEYRGQALHTADYRRPEPFQGQRVLVVGGGNGAVRIAIELATVARVTLASYAPIRTMPQRLLGRDIHFWTHTLGLDRTQWVGDRSLPAYLSDPDRAALAAGRPDQRPMFTHFTAEGVAWADGSRETIDTVIFATGYRPNLDYLAGLGALSGKSHVLQESGRSTSVPGLYYSGLPRQRSAASATLRGVGGDARVVVDHMARFCSVKAPRASLLARINHSLTSARI
jgi:putative flavoprotein involved in K+ transport